MSLRDQLWVTASRQTLDMDEFVILVEILRTRLLQQRASSSSDLAGFVDDIGKALGSQHFPLLQVFWENYHAQPIRSRVASELESALIQIARNCDSNVPLDVKRAICEAIASLYSLDGSKFLGELDVAWIRLGLPVSAADFLDLHLPQLTPAFSVPFYRL